MKKWSFWAATLLIAVACVRKSPAALSAGEMMVRVIFQVTRKQFLNVKIVFDTSLVLISATIAFFLFGTPLGDGDSVVIREGTLISAIFTGWLMRYFDPLVDRVLRRMGV